MGQIRLLDCTLRDGGYINDWCFGEYEIPQILRNLDAANIDIIEIGFLKNEPYLQSRTVFNSMGQVKKLLKNNKNKDIQYAVMAEVINPLPLDMLAPADDESADIIRVIVWKTKRDEEGKIVDALQEGYEYCKGIVEKGYKLCVQPARVDQYSADEFKSMINQFSQLNPLAIYVVDSWGTQNVESLLGYMRLADQILKPEICLGYHGHNNLMQAFSVAQAIVNNKFKRDIIIDASIYGIGRGAGNLNTELFAKYMNDEYSKQYEIEPMTEIFDKYLFPIYEKKPWGYSLPFFMTAVYRCNPNYASYYSGQLGLSSSDIANILKEMTDIDKVIFNKKIANQYWEQYRSRFPDSCFVEK